jgi:hypothetical protein
MIAEGTCHHSPTATRHWSIKRSNDPRRRTAKRVGLFFFYFNKNLMVSPLEKMDAGFHLHSIEEYADSLINWDAHRKESPICCCWIYGESKQWVSGEVFMRKLSSKNIQHTHSTPEPLRLFPPFLSVCVWLVSSFRNEWMNVWMTRGEGKWQGSRRSFHIRHVDVLKTYYV